MATRILVNSLLFGTRQLWPGSLYDSVTDAAEITSITAAGGLFYDGADSLVASAAELARAVRKRAGEISEAESLVQSGVQASQRLAIGSVTAQAGTTAAATAVVHETFSQVEAPATALGTIAESATSADPTAQPGHPRVLDVVFAAGWQGGDVTVAGVNPAGAAISETFVSPGAGGGTVSGTKAFALIDDPGGIANSTAGGAADVATVQTAAGIGLSRSPYSALVKLSVDGADEAAAATSFTDGTFEPTTAPDGTKTFEVWYR